MAGLILESREEINQILKEVSVYAIWGLVETDGRVKQFYFERILLSMGMNLAEIRARLGVEEGIPSDYPHKMP
jgi:hypothetical protein